jgi:hypothetical protein
MFANIAIIALLLPGLLFLIGIVSLLLVNNREVAKVHRDGFCDQCGYDLTGNTTGVCPECGLAGGVGNE